MKMDKCLYKVDFVAKTITITAECAEKMNDPDTTEYRAIRQLCADFPAMKIVKRTHRTPPQICFQEHRGKVQL